MNSIFFSGGAKRHVASANWYSEIIAGEYTAVIFDCDGTLVESGEAHFKSFRTAVRAQGYDLERDWYQRPIFFFKLRSGWVSPRPEPWSSKILSKVCRQLSLLGRTLYRFLITEMSQFSEILHFGFKF